MMSSIIKNVVWLLKKSLHTTISLTIYEIDTSHVDDNGIRKSEPA